MFYLSQKATLKHHLRSAFLRSSTFRGWVYIEAQINNELIKLLKSTPGLVHRYPDVDRSQIDIGDWTRLLTMTDQSIGPSVDSWVRVRSGLYKGDVGFLMGIETWGGFSVLLIPRLPPPYDETKSSGKRKRPSSRPIPALFNPEIVAYTYPQQPVYRDDGFYHFLGSRFQHGLVYKKYNIHSVSPASEIPINAFHLFRDSCHPKLTTFPRPVEWVFEEGEEVIVISSQKWGIVSQVQVLFAEVDLHNGEGLVNISWPDLHKAFQIGDFIESMNGLESDFQGWVTEIENERIEVLGQFPTSNVLNLNEELMSVCRMLCCTFVSLILFVDAEFSR